MQASNLRWGAVAYQPRSFDQGKCTDLAEARATSVLSGHWEQRYKSLSATAPRLLLRHWRANVGWSVLALPGSEVESLKSGLEAGALDRGLEWFADHPLA